MCDVCKTCKMCDTRVIVCARVHLSVGIAEVSKLKAIIANYFNYSCLNNVIAMTI